MNYQELKDAALKVNQVSGVLQGYYSILSLRGGELSRLDLIRIIKTLDIAVYENCSAYAYTRVIEDSVKNVGVDFEKDAEETFVRRITRLSLEAAGRKVAAEEVDSLVSEFSHGLAAHEIVCIYATKQFSVTILPDEDFNVAIQTENQSRLTVDAKYLEELTIVTELQQAVQAELDAVKEWI